MTFSLDDSLPLLERTPRTLHALLAGLPAGWLTADEGELTFSAWDNVAHMAYAERVNWPVRARAIMEREQPTFEPFDPWGFQAEAPYARIEDALDRFAQLRQQNLDMLRSWRLDDVALARTAQHPAFGSVTLAQLLATWVAHDLAHVAQTSRVLAKQYRAAVGPWAAYLPVLQPR